MLPSTFFHHFRHRGAEGTLHYIILISSSQTTPRASGHHPKHRIRILSRFRCKVGLQSGGTWFSSGTEQCQRQTGSSRRYTQLCMNRFFPALQRLEFRSTDEIRRSKLIPGRGRVRRVSLGPRIVSAHWSNTTNPDNTQTNTEHAAAT